MRKLCCGLLLLSLTACDADEPCDEGLRYEQGMCSPDTPAAGSGGSAGSDASMPPADSGMSAEDAGADECTEDLDAVLGADCTSDEQCNCAAPYCAIRPGQPMGICTRYCNPDPDDCPDGWSCFDLSALGLEGYEPFCTEDD